MTGTEVARVSNGRLAESGDIAPASVTTGVCSSRRNAARATAP